MKKATWIEGYRVGESEPPVFCLFAGSELVAKISTRSFTALKDMATTYGVEAMNILVAPEGKPIPQDITQPVAGFTKAKLLEIATSEAEGGYGWRDNTGARKYTADFEPWFGKGRFPWCGAFVRWCAVKAGLEMPVLNPSSFGYSFALVEAWQQWAKSEGFYIDNKAGFIPEPGDIVLFDWDFPSLDAPDNDYEDHIGVFSHVQGNYFVCAEGNYKDKTAIVNRDPRSIQGFVRIPDGYTFE